MWVKLDDKFFRHPKIRRCGIEARWLFVAGLCHCQEFLTDGFIDKVYLPDIATDLKRPKQAVAELVREGLWEEASDGWRVHDYLVFQKSRQWIEDERARKAVAGEAGGKKSGEVRRSKAEADSQAKSKQPASEIPNQTKTPTPTPTPRPKFDKLGSQDFQLPAIGESPREEETPAQFVGRLWEQYHGRNEASGRNREAIDRWAGKYPPAFWQWLIPRITKGKPFLFITNPPEPGVVPLVEDRYLSWTEQLKDEDKQRKPVFSVVKNRPEPELRQAFESPF